MSSFASLGLSPESLRAVADQGYAQPTPIQARSIPLVLAGRDLLAGAETGTGKTAAFVLPMVQRLHDHRAGAGKRVRGLVVVPTRELALQVEASIRTYSSHRPIRSVAIYGGVRMDPQVRALRGGAEVVVATPGRLLDHVRQGTIRLDGVEILVLDEADRMLDMGFINDIKAILGLLPSERQSLLFSATFSPRIRSLAATFLRDPESVDVAPRNATAVPIAQVVHPVERGRKRALLSHLLTSGAIDQALVFARTKRGANRLAEQLVKDGIKAAAIHGNKSQSQRVRALGAFKNGGVRVLVATDVAARGLDILALPHVVNYELPTVAEDYVHRIGRTGRAGLEGIAVSLVSADEREQLGDIERLLGRAIERVPVAGFENGPVLAETAPATRGRGRAERGRSEHRPARGGRRPGARPRAPQPDTRPDGRATHSTMPGERIGGNMATRPARPTRPAGREGGAAAAGAGIQGGNVPSGGRRRRPRGRR